MDNTEILIALIGFSGLILSGLITFLGVKLTINNQNKIEQKRLKKEQEEKDKEFFEKRPTLEIVDYKVLGNLEVENEERNKSDVEILPCSINVEVLHGHIKVLYKNINSKKFYTVKYVLKNTGHITIYDITFYLNLYKNTSLLDAKNDHWKFWVNNNLLDRAVILEKIIKPGQEITLLVHYPDKNRILLSNLGSPMLAIVSIDEYRNTWRQALNIPEQRITLMKRYSYDDYISDININALLECYRKPYLW